MTRMSYSREFKEEALRLVNEGCELLTQVAGVGNRHLLSELEEAAGCNSHR